MSNEVTKETIVQGNLLQRSPAGDLPMATLLIMLRRRGFIIKPDDYLEILKIVECFGADTLPVKGRLSGMAEELAKRICPLVATNEQEQKKFYQVFDEYTKSIEVIPPEQDAPKQGLVKESYGLVKKYKRHVLVVLAVLVAIVVYTLIRVVQPAPLTASFTFKPTVTTPGDTVTFDASAIFAGRGQDSSKARVVWNFGEGWTDTGRLVTTHVFANAGEQLVLQKILSDALKIEKETDSQVITVCATRPDINIIPVTEIPRRGKAFVLLAHIANNNGITRTFWLHDIDTVSHNERYAGIADSAGVYSFTFVAVVGDVNSPCTRRDNYSFSVEDTLPPKQIVIQQTGDTLQAPSKVNPAWNIFLLAPGITLLAASFLLIYFRSHRKAPELPPPPPLRPPYEIPFENNALRLIAPEQDMQRVSRQMRQKTEHELLEINIPKTIQHTIRSGGLDELIQTPKLQARDYLVLIDRSNPNSMLVSLFDYLVNNWREENIPVERFYYNTHFGRLFNEDYVTGISLRQLAERYRNYTLIILGNAHDLVYTAYPVIEKKFLEELNEWEQKAIITPVCYTDWGEKEEVIKKYFTLLPADAEGLDILVPAIQERRLNNESYLDACKNFYSASARQFKKATGLHTYLGDDDLFQWICAICIYPKLRWEVLIETGAAILTGKGEKLNYSNLLKICRIAWMQKGAIPENIRLELLKSLTEANEITARQVLLRMIEHVDKTVPQSSAAYEEEKYSAQVINEFMLFSNDPIINQQYGSSQVKFEQLWKNNRVSDAPLHNYITKKKNDNWGTLIKHEGQNVSILDYFSAEVKRINKATRKKIWPLQGIALALILLFGLLNLGSNNLNDTKIAKALRLYIPDSSKDVTLNFIIADNFCDTQLVRNNINAYVSINTIPYPLALTSDAITDSANFDLSVDSAAADTAYVPTGLRSKSIRYASSVKVPYEEAINGQCFLTVKWDTDSLLTELPALQNTVIEAGLPGCDTSTITSIPPPDTPAKKPDSGELYTCSLPISFLPTSLNEIFSSRLSKFIQINLAERSIDYAETSKDKSSYYSIGEVCRSNKGTYRLNCNTRGGTMVFFIRNIRGSSFELSACFRSMSDKRDPSQLTDSACGPYAKMSLYYPADPSRIYLPVNAVDLVPSEFNKVKAKADSINTYRDAQNQQKADVQNQLKVDARLYENTDNLKPVDSKKLSTSYFPSNYFSYYTLNRQLLSSPTPFDRNYISITLSPARPPKPDPCAKTYITIGEAAQELALDLVCRLNLSNRTLSTLPPQLSQMPSLQYLDIRENYLTTQDSITLKRILPPKCQLLFSPQLSKGPIQGPNEPAQESQPWKFITQVNIDNQYYPLSSQRSLVSQIADQLTSNEKTQIKIVAYYSSDAQKTLAEKKAGAFKYYITSNFKSKMPFENRIVTEAVSLSQRRQLQAQGASYFFQAAPEYVDIFGINISTPTNKN